MQGSCLLDQLCTLTRSGTEVQFETDLKGPSFSWPQPAALTDPGRGREEALLTRAREYRGGGVYLCPQNFLEGESRCPLVTSPTMKGLRVKNAVCRVAGQVAKTAGFTFPRGSAVPEAWPSPASHRVRPAPLHSREGSPLRPCAPSSPPASFYKSVPLNPDPHQPTAGSLHSLPKETAGQCVTTQEPVGCCGGQELRAVLPPSAGMD